MKKRISCFVMICILFVCFVFTVNAESFEFDFNISNGVEINHENVVVRSYSGLLPIMEEHLDVSGENHVPFSVLSGVIPDGVLINDNVFSVPSLIVLGAEYGANVILQGFEFSYLGSNFHKMYEDSTFNMNFTLSNSNFDMTVLSLYILQNGENEIVKYTQESVSIDSSGSSENISFSYDFTDIELGDYESVFVGYVLYPLDDLFEITDIVFSVSDVVLNADMPNLFDFYKMPFIVDGIKSVGVWFWNGFTDFIDMISSNSLLLWTVSFAILAGCIYMLIRILRKFGLKGRGGRVK